MQIFTLIPFTPKSEVLLHLLSTITKGWQHQKTYKLRYWNLCNTVRPLVKNKFIGQMKLVSYAFVINLSECPKSGPYIV